MAHGSLIECVITFLVQLAADETPSFLLLGAAVDFLVDGGPHWVIWVYMSLSFTWAVCDALLPNFFNIARVFDCNS